MTGRLVVIAGLAILAGIALGLRDLVSPAPQIPLPLESLVLVGVFLTVAAIGWSTGQLIGPPVGVAAAPASALVAIGVALIAKQLRFPGAPPTGDGFEILIALYALTGLVGAIVGLHPALRVRSVGLAAAVGTGLLVVAGLVGTLPYVLARS